jgi:sugar diacid utilization regulator
VSDADLVRTVETYFEFGGNSARIAEALFIHVNTLYQRLARVDQILGVFWRRGEHSLQVHLALRLSKLMETTS